MHGLVRYVRGDRTAVRRDGGDYILLETIGEAELKPDTIVRGDLETFGGAVLETDLGDRVKVFVQDVCDEGAAERWVAEAQELKPV